MRRDPTSDRLRGGANVLLFSGDEARPYGWVPLERLLRRALAEHVPTGRRVVFVVTLLPKKDPTPADETSWVNLHGKNGVFYVYVFVDKLAVHAGEHPVRELLEPILSRLVPADQASRWFFEITRPSDGEMLVLHSRPFPHESEPDPTADQSESGPEPTRTAEETRRLPLSVRRVEDADLPPSTEALTVRSLPTVVLRIRVGHGSEHTLGLNDLVRPAPEVQGAVDVDLDQPRSVPFSIRKVTEPELPLLATAGLDIEPGRRDAVTVVLRPHAHRLLSSELELSFRMEEGGFLAGRVYRVARGQERYVVLIDQVLPAKHTGASSVHFTFTGDSFQEMTRELSGGPSRLVGWYHTHLFSGDHSVLNLSSVDVELHHSTFRQPWQVAGLINLTRTERRLRFYTATEDDMESCALWVTDERDGHGATRLDLGDR